MLIYLYRSYAAVVAMIAAIGFCGAAAAADYVPPSDVSKEDTVAMIRNFMSKPDIPLKTGDRGYVEDIIRIRAVDMDWDIGMSVHEPADPSKIPVGADGKKIGIFLLHGGSGDFKTMHRRADLIAYLFAVTSPE